MLQTLNFQILKISRSSSKGSSHSVKRHKITFFCSDMICDWDWKLCNLLDMNILEYQQLTIRFINIITC